MPILTEESGPLRKRHWWLLLVLAPMAAVGLLLLPLARPVELRLGEHGLSAAVRQNPFHPNHGRKYGLIESVARYGVRGSEQRFTSMGGSQGTVWRLGNDEWGYYLRL